MRREGRQGREGGERREGRRGGREGGEGGEHQYIPSTFCLGNVFLLLLPGYEATLTYTLYCFSPFPVLPPSFPVHPSSSPPSRATSLGEAAHTHPFTEQQLHPEAAGDILPGAAPLHCPPLSSLFTSSHTLTLSSHIPISPSPHTLTLPSYTLTPSLTHPHTLTHPHLTLPSHTLSHPHIPSHPHTQVHKEMDTLQLDQTQSTLAPPPSLSSGSPEVTRRIKVEEGEATPEQAEGKVGHRMLLMIGS